MSRKISYDEMGSARETMETRRKRKNKHEQRRQGLLTNEQQKT